MSDQLEIDIAVIKEKINIVAEIKQDVKDLSDKVDQLHSNYMQIQGTLTTFADFDKRMRNVERKVYIFSGAAAVLGWIAPLILDYIK